MRALVTGGAGFIGSHLVDALVTEDHDVVVLDDMSSGRREQVDPRATLVQGDVSDPDAVARAVDGCEVVFHLAALRAVLASVERPLDTNRVNVGGTLAVLAAAQHAGVRRVVAASSSSVYGGAQQRPTPESADLVPRSPYAVSKLAGEQYCRVYWELFGLETVCLRYFNVYGPRQHPDSAYAAVIPLFIDAISTDIAPEVHGDGRQSRDFTFVTDAVSANLKAARADSEACAGKAYNIAGGHPYSLLDVLDIIGQALGRAAVPVHTEARAGDIRHSAADIGAAARDLGHVPAVSLPEGLDRMLASGRSDAAAGVA